jgi:hypothetical protein
MGGRRLVEILHEASMISFDEPTGKALLLQCDKSKLKEKFCA